MRYRQIVAPRRLKSTQSPVADRELLTPVLSGSLSSRFSMTAGSEQLTYRQRQCLRRIPDRSLGAPGAEAIQPDEDGAAIRHPVRGRPATLRVGEVAVAANAIGRDTGAAGGTRPADVAVTTEIDRREPVPETPYPARRMTTESRAA